MLPEGSGADHFACMGECLVCDLDAAEHAGDFLDTLFGVEGLEPRACLFVAYDLCHLDMVVGEGGDLG